MQFFSAKQVGGNDTAKTEYADKSWQPLATGSYNQVMRSVPDFSQALFTADSNYRGPYVYKKPIVLAQDPFSGLNDSNRAVNIWHEINKDDPSSMAALYKDGWVANYYPNNRQASDEEIAVELVNIYKKSGRIVFDAPTEGNVLVVDESDTVGKKTKTKVVDVDLAMKRSESPLSRKYASNLINNQFAHYWSDPDLNRKFPKTLDIIQNLIYFEDHVSYGSPQTAGITYASIAALTYGRQQKIPLTSVLFQEIQHMVNIGVEPRPSLMKSLYALQLRKKAREERVSELKSGEIRPGF